jgi:sporulation protein YlmC with PRC-barrel domain
MPEMTEAYEWQGRTVVGSDGEKIGKVSEIYLDERTHKPESATASSGLFGNESRFVPLAGASPDGEDVPAQVTKEQVKDAPSIDYEGQLSEQEEAKLFEHDGIPYTDQGTVTAQRQPRAGQGRQTGDEATEGREPGGRRVGRDTSGPTTDEAMTRSEELRAAPASGRADVRGCASTWSPSR